MGSLVVVAKILEGDSLLEDILREDNQQVDIVMAMEHIQVHKLITKQLNQQFILRHFINILIQSGFDQLFYAYIL